MLFTPGKQYVFESKLLFASRGSFSAQHVASHLPAGHGTAWPGSSRFQCLARCSLEELSSYPKRPAAPEPICEKFSVESELDTSSEESLACLH